LTSQKGSIGSPRNLVWSNRTCPKNKGEKKSKKRTYSTFSCLALDQNKGAKGGKQNNKKWAKDKKGGEEGKFTDKKITGSKKGKEERIFRGRRIPAEVRTILVVKTLLKEGE